MNIRSVIWLGFAFIWIAFSVVALVGGHHIESSLLAAWGLICWLQHDINVLKDRITLGQMNLQNLYIAVKTGTLDSLQSNAEDLDMMLNQLIKDMEEYQNRKEKDDE